MPKRPAEIAAPAPSDSQEQPQGPEQAPATTPAAQAAEEPSAASQEPEQPFAPATVFDGGAEVLELAEPIDYEVRVTDRTTGRVCDPAEYEVQKQSVRRARGEWARGRGRWLVERREA